MSSQRFGLMDDSLYVQHLAAIVKSSTDAIVSVSLDKTILSWNKGAQTIFGYRADEIIGKHLDILIPKDQLDNVHDLYQMVLKGKKVRNYESLRISKSGKQIPVAVTISLVKDAFGAVVGYSSVIRDIRQKREFEQQLVEGNRFLSSVFASIDDILMVLDKDFRIIRINKAVEIAFNIKTRANGQRCYEVLHSRKSPCEICTLKRCLETSNPGQQILRKRDLQGVTRIFDLHYSPLKDLQTQEIKGIIVYGRDITEKKRIEVELSRLENLRLVGEMAASIGHEVRNPMTTVRGFLQLFGAKERYAEDKPLFDLMINELDRANQIITDFLSLARNKKVSIQTINLKTLLEAMKPLLVSDATRLEQLIVFRLQQVPDVMADEKEIRQLVINIVRNALEAMGEGGKVTIRTFAAGDSVSISISDRGQGIASEILPKLGTPFITTKDNGTGLGLAVCYSIAERNNAEIRHKTSKKGTIFTVRFNSVVPFPLNGEQSNLN